MHCMWHGKSHATAAPWQQIAMLHSHAQQAAKYGSKNMAATPATTVPLRRPVVLSYGAAMLSGGWVSGCGCGGAPVPVILGTGGSNPPQVCEQPPRDACTHTSSQRVQ